MTIRGTTGLVFSSTMGVYGASGRPTDDLSVVALHEAMQLRPADIYGLTKVAGEEVERLRGPRAQQLRDRSRQLRASDRESFHAH